MSTVTSKEGATRRAGACAVTQLSADGAALQVEDLSVGYYQKDGRPTRLLDRIATSAKQSTAASQRSSVGLPLGPRL